jgi:hypothetical protein
MIIPPAVAGVFGIEMCFSETAALICAASAHQRSVGRHVPSPRDISAAR